MKKFLFTKNQRSIILNNYSKLLLKKIDRFVNSTNNKKSFRKRCIFKRLNEIILKEIHFYELL